MARRRQYLPVPAMQPPKPPSRWLRWAKILAGWKFILLGVAGFILPIMPGFVFLAVGLYILADEYAWARRWLDWLRRRFPRYASSIDEGQRRSVEVLKRFRRTVRRTINNRGFSKKG